MSSLDHAKREMETEENKLAPVPLTIITGFLGSGKSTLLSYILNSKAHGLKIAVVNNEFAEVQIGTSKELTSKAALSADISESKSGCLCCGGGDDFRRMLHELLHFRKQMDYVIVETTGMADPAFAKMFFSDPILREQYVLDGVVTMVDSKHVYQQMEQSKEAAENQSNPDSAEVVNETLEQIAIADRIVLNKQDLVSSEELEKLEGVVKKINPLATVLRTEYARVGDLKQLLGIKAFRLDRVLDRDAGFLDFRPYRIHDQSVESVALVGNGAVDIVLLEKWVRKTILACGGGLLRTKGVFTVQGGDNSKGDDDQAEVVVQGVRQMVDFQPRAAAEGKAASKAEDEKGAATPLPAEEHKNKLILIGHGLGGKVESILASFRADVQLAQWRAGGCTDEQALAKRDTATHEPYMGVYEPAMHGATRADFIRMAIMASILIFLYFWD